MGKQIVCFLQNVPKIECSHLVVFLVLQTILHPLNALAHLILRSAPQVGTVFTHPSQEKPKGQTGQMFRLKLDSEGLEEPLWGPRQMCLLSPHTQPLSHMTPTSWYFLSNCLCVLGAGQGEVVAGDLALGLLSQRLAMSSHRSSRHLTVIQAHYTTSISYARGEVDFFFPSRIHMANGIQNKFLS